MLNISAFCARCFLPPVESQKSADWIRERNRASSKEEPTLSSPRSVLELGVGRVGLLTGTAVVQESVAGNLGVGDDLNVYGVACMDGKVWQLLLR